MTVVWANDLKSKTDFKKGDTLRIPPVTGLIVKVAATDTLDCDRRALRRRRHRHPGDQRHRRPEPGRRPGPRPARRQGQGDATKPTIKPSSRIRRSGGGGGEQHPGPATYTGGKFLCPGRRWRQLHQPVLPLRPLRDRHRGRLRLDRSRGGRRDRDLRRLEEQRRRLPGLDRPRLRPVHDLQPHVGDHGRARPARRARPAGRPGRPDRQRDRSAPPLRGLAWPGLGRRPRA